jgi:hypothetical protein
MSGVTSSYFYGGESQTGRNTRNPTFSLEEIDRIISSDRSFASKLIDAASKTATLGACGYFAGHVFSLIDPVGGAIFGVTAAVSHRLSGYILDKFQISSILLGSFAYNAAYFTGIGIGAAVTTTAGFPIAFSTTVVLNAVIILTYALARSILSNSANCIGGAALAIKDRLV